MKLFSVVALLSAVVSTANAFTINTPTGVAQCQPILIGWDASGSTPPYILTVHPGATPSDPALITWGNLTGSSFSWPSVTFASGTSLSLALRDSTGNTVQSAPFSVQSGSDATCLTSSSTGSSPAGSSSTGSSPAGSSLSTIPGSSTSLPTTATRTSTSTSTTKSPSTVTTPSSGSSPTATGGASGALSNAVNLGSAGFLAALVGAVLV